MAWTVFVHCMNLVCTYTRMYVHTGVCSYVHEMFSKFSFTKNSQLHNYNIMTGEELLSWLLVSVDLLQACWKRLKWGSAMGCNGS